MEKIFEQAKDLHVRNFVAYAKAADSKLYYEAAYTNQVAQADVEDAFGKGALLVKNGDAMLAPVAVDGNKVFTLAKTGNPTEEFDATDTYAVGDCVIKDGVAYKCKTTISVAAAWDATKWDQITTVDFVKWEAAATV